MNIQITQKEKKLKFGIGQSLKRLEDDKFLTGNGSYNDDIDFKRRLITIENTKNGYPRIIPMTDKSYNILKTLLEIFCCPLPISTARLLMKQFFYFLYSEIELIPQQRAELIVSS